MMGANDQQGPVPPPPGARQHSGKTWEGVCAGGAGEGASKRGGKGKKKGGKRGDAGKGELLQQELPEGAGLGAQQEPAQPLLCASQAFMPFGLGRRSCVGQVFSQVGRVPMCTRLCDGKQVFLPSVAQ